MINSGLYGTSVQGNSLIKSTNVHSSIKLKPALDEVTTLATRKRSRNARRRFASLRTEAWRIWNESYENNLRELGFIEKGKEWVVDISIQDHDSVNDLDYSQIRFWKSPTTIPRFFSASDPGYTPMTWQSIKATEKWRKAHHENLQQLGFTALPASPPARRDIAFYWMDMPTLQVGTDRGWWAWPGAKSYEGILELAPPIRPTSYVNISMRELESMISKYNGWIDFDSVKQRLNLDVLESLDGRWITLMKAYDDDDFYQMRVPKLPPRYSYTWPLYDGGGAIANKIVQNPKLRHDVNFDPDLHFRPNLDGEKGRKKTLKANDFWSLQANNQQSVISQLLAYFGLKSNKEQTATATATKKKYEILGTLNGHNVAAFPDTGSTQNIMTMAFATRHGLPILQDPEHLTIVTLANGQKVTTSGTVNAKWAFATDPSERHELTFDILSSCAHDVLLGQPFLEATETMSLHQERITSRTVYRGGTYAVNAIGTSQLRVRGKINGTEALGLPDTGCETNIMSLAYAQAQGLSIDSDLDHQGLLMFADGSTQSTVGQVYTTWEFGDGGGAHNMMFQVLDGCPYDIVLGQDILYDTKAFLTHAASMLHLELHPDVQLWTGENVNLVTWIPSIFRRKKKQGPNQSPTSIDEKSKEITHELNRRAMAEAIHDEMPDGPAKDACVAREELRRRERTLQRQHTRGPQHVNTASRNGIIVSRA